MSVKGFINGVWQFCSYLFVPQWGSQSGGQELLYTRYSLTFAQTGGRGTGTCPNLKNQRFAYLFPHSVLSWEGLYRRSGNGQFRSFMY